MAEMELAPETQIPTLEPELTKVFTHHSPSQTAATPNLDVTLSSGENAPIEAKPAIEEKELEINPAKEPSVALNTEQNIISDGVDKDEHTDTSSTHPLVEPDGEAADEAVKTSNSDPASDAGKPEVHIPWILDVRKVDYEHFKTFFTKEDGGWAIDVLHAGSNLLHDVQRLHFLRKWYKTKKSKERRSFLPRASEENTWLQRVRLQHPALIFHLAKVVGETWPTDSSRTFFRPFRVFIFFQLEMKKALAKLEAKWEGQSESESLNVTSNIDDIATDVFETFNKRRDPEGSDDGEDDDFFHDEAQNPQMYTFEALQAMRCYVDFVEKDIMPLYKMFDGTSRRKIRYEDLWMLFRCGELIYASHTSDVRPRHRHAGNSDSSITQSTVVWKIYTLNCPNDFREYPSFEARRKPKSPPDEEDDPEDDFTIMNNFRVWAYYIDFDGVSYGPVRHRFTIPRFQGEIDIMELPCYPIRYAEDTGLLAKRQIEGMKFKECIEMKYLTYNGWSAASTPTGDPIRYDEDGETNKYSEFIESHVIVDFVEAFQAYPFWKPEFHDPKQSSDDNWFMVEDPYAIEDRTNDSEITEKLQINDGVTMWQRQENLRADRFLKTYKEQMAPGKDKKVLELKEDDFILLAKRVFAYILRDRKFALLDCRFLEHIEQQHNVFDRLKIHREYKGIVKGLVASHFMQKTLERKFSALSKTEKTELTQLNQPLENLQNKSSPRTKKTETSSNVTAEGFSQDIVQGKGRGLVILLHGVPGVGKTATAEAVALENQKPLFVITCGDLGLTPSDVEHHLTEVFRLAHLWDCILLLDEADVFLSKRSNIDLNRNALVSVFLRVLEYYSGILFLTTNRVGILDEAFKSRIHISLYYPALKTSQAVEIFKMNITHLRDIAKTRSKIANEPLLDIKEDEILKFAKNLFQDKIKHNEVPWNGRQIRNAFQIASSLSYNAMYTEYAMRLQKVQNGELKEALYSTPILDDTHFNVVATVTDDFDYYIREVKGKSDAAKARLAGERADNVNAVSTLGLPKLSSGGPIEATTTTTTITQKPELPLTPEDSRQRKQQDNPMLYDEDAEDDEIDWEESEHTATYSASGRRARGMVDATHRRRYHDREYISDDYDSLMPKEKGRGQRENESPALGRRRGDRREKDPYQEKSYRTGRRPATYKEDVSPRPEPSRRPRVSRFDEDDSEAYN